MSPMHLDEAALNTLKDIMQSDFDLLLQTFIKDSHTRIASLDQAITQGDSENIRQAAHSFKGSAANLAAMPLAELCKQLETKGREQQLAGCDQLFNEVREEFAQVKLLLEKKLGGSE